MKIFLIGFMGCGKTTFGKKLASKLGFRFIDLDKSIEQSAGITIPEYFKEYGETAFRVKEREVLQKTTVPDNSVIATGGGAPCFFDNMEWMNEQGATVYICLTPKALATRLESATDERPVLQGLKGEELERFIASKLEEREVFYKKASIIVEGINISPENFIPKLEEYQRR
ncbi:shikimate kinase [Desertivirga brevis]|uniref:shikimate kinase n=1 Tax=Desertivirga brevis TaxID=2810310 RepID=UPI001A96BF9B|nr:shikimate kinase [Pedobacter sp. SYSU D00873]